MPWYDTFSRFYDRSLERLYREPREQAAALLDLVPGLRVLDAPCGTGQSLDVLAPAVGDTGAVIGVDLSRGMLDRARGRVARLGLDNVTLVASDVHTVALDAPVERLHVFLGLTTIPRWEEAFVHLWSLVAPHGRCVVVDVHNARPGVRGKLVNLVARADIRRQVWRPLEACARDFQYVALSSRPEHGGELFAAVGVKG